MWDSVTDTVTLASAEEEDVRGVNARDDSEASIGGYSSRERIRLRTRVAAR
jgi:hypothetical protein